MNTAIAFWEFMGFIFISVIGFISHFIYGWLGYGRIIAVFGSVNESVWEHQKLVFWPAFIFAFIESFILKPSIGGFWFAKSVSILFMPAFIIAAYYLYTAVLGRRFLAVDISLFFIAAGLGQLISYRMLMAEYKQYYSDATGISIILLLSMLFIIFTFNPPHKGLFKDSTNEIYGINNEKKHFPA